ncbi:glycerate kinase [Neolewinella lacunae]|uniref:Glycerate kinase n=1 Tax=Neolewinella lacunae TaxID=1517758 RepID=A0A923PRJ9_9BACT|nr:glycerate kinase [Neolewinella lacunae]MBC6996184.1 glycerate kinase [Neolewinella lacunae]MDN3635358.1 glycerate kinase [Neolewinella lacunae]
MNVLIAPDKFKGSLSAQEVCTALASGLARRYPAASLRCHPLADGGDGTLAILRKHLDLQPRPVPSADPLGRPITATYLLGPDNAFIEVASASGLVLLNPTERNPLNTNTHGTGLLLADALTRGVQNIFLLLGGSATHDVGTGIATALGFRFTDEREQAVLPSGGNLQKIRQIHPPAEQPWAEKNIVLLCDVTNPLLGPHGAAHTYAAQKGAGPKAIESLEAGTRSFSELLAEHYGADIAALPGGGAAGGIGAGLSALLGARLRSGFQTISALTHLEAAIAWADHVVTGEGQLDGQSLQGKVVGGVLDICVQQQKPCSIVVGRNATEGSVQFPSVVQQVQEIMSLTNQTEDAMRGAARYLGELGARMVL